MSARRVFRLVLANLLIIVATWLGLLFVTALLGDLYELAKPFLPRETDERALLPNYADHADARQLFLDQEKTEEDYVPFVAWKRLPMATPHIHIGEDGNRVHTRGPENNEPGARSIGFFGGSTMWGTGVDDDGTIPAIFDQLTTGYRVTNYAQGGYNTRQMLALLVNLIDTGRMPEVVVFYGGFNHVWTHCNYAVTRLLNGHMIERKIRAALVERSRWGYVYDEIVAPPVDFARRLIGIKRFTANDFACHDDPLRAEQVSAVLVRSWEMARVLVEHAGGRFYAFLQPVAYIGHPRLDYLELPRLMQRRQFETVYPIIRAELAALHAAWVVDLSDAFDGDEILYIDDAHVSRRGNEIIARRMLEKIGGS
jgi:hypothetical protein